MKYILLCLAVLVSALPVSAQNPGPIYPTNTIPTGACSQNVGYLYTPTGVLYTCQNGTWAALSGGSGSGNNTYCADATGSTTTYTCPVPTPTITTLTGLIVTFVPQTTNTGTSTLNVAALGGKTLKQADCSTNVASGALVGGTAYLFSYNGTSLCQAGSGGGSTCAAYTVLYTDTIFQAASTTATKTLVALAAGEYVTGVVIDNNTSPGAAFAGTAVTSTTVSLGSSGVGTAATSYAPAANIFVQGVQPDGGLQRDSAGANVVAVFTANTNFGTGVATVLTAGSVSIKVCRLVLP